MSEPKPKSFEISKRAVWEAWLRVKANKGAAGVDEQSIEEFERDLQGNLYKLWNRLSSGSYMPPPVRAVEIPKRDGSPRVLGVPTVADRIAQTVVRAVPGARGGAVLPRRTPMGIGRVGRRWTRSGSAGSAAGGWTGCSIWTSGPSSTASLTTSLLKAVARHTDLRWVLLYVERWLKAPLQREDGSLVERDRGTPQGSAISPLLANMFMHYAFDAWMAREHRLILFERYCDDVIVHARSEQQARELRDAIASRLAECGPRAQRAQDPHRVLQGRRRGAALTSTTSFDFLGYTFRPRLSRSKTGGQFVNFLPAASDDARKRMRREVRRWRLHLRPDKTISDLARIFNPIIQGWINYYGRFYRSVLIKVLRRINAYLVRWAQCKYKRLRRYPAKARRFLVDVFRRQPGLFAHWRFGARPDGWTMGAR